MRFPIFTLTGSVLAATIAAYTGFTGFVDGSGWKMQRTSPFSNSGEVFYYTGVDLAQRVAISGGGFGLLGFLIDWHLTRNTGRIDSRKFRSRLLQLREENDLSQEDKQTIDLLLAKTSPPTPLRGPKT